MIKKIKNEFDSFYVLILLSNTFRITADVDRTNVNNITNKNKLDPKEIVAQLKNKIRSVELINANKFIAAHVPEKKLFLLKFFMIDTDDIAKNIVNTGYMNKYLSVGLSRPISNELKEIL